MVAAHRRRTRRARARAVRCRPNSPASVSSQSSRLSQVEVVLCPPSTRVRTQPRSTAVPVACRRWAVTVSANPDSGDVALKCAVGERVHRHRPLDEADTGERSARIVAEMPVTDAVLAHRCDAETHRRLRHQTVRERQRIVERIAQPGVDPPAPGRVRRVGRSSTINAAWLRSVESLGPDWS